MRAFTRLRLLFSRALAALLDLVFDLGEGPPCRSGAVPFFPPAHPRLCDGMHHWESLSSQSHPLFGVLPVGALEAPRAGSFPRCGRPCPGQDDARPVRPLSAPGLGGRHGVFPAAAAPSHGEEAGRLAGSTSNYSLHPNAFIAGRPRRLPSASGHAAAPHLCRRARFPLAPFSCSSSEAALGFCA